MNASKLSFPYWYGKQFSDLIDILIQSLSILFKIEINIKCTKMERVFVTDYYNTL